MGGGSNPPFETSMAGGAQLAALSNQFARTSKAPAASKQTGNYSSKRCKRYNG